MADDEIPEFLRRKKAEPVADDSDLIGDAEEAAPVEEETADEEPVEDVPDFDEPEEETPEEPEAEEDDSRVSGHNSGVAGFASKHLRSIVERVERLEEEKKTIGDDIKEVYAEAKANGFDTKIIRKIVALRKKDREERQEEEALLETYMLALGMI